MTPKSRFDLVDGRRIHARTAGRGQDVVLVHGLLASHRYWEPTLRLLGDRCRAWAPDLPGHGLSEHAPQPLDVDGRADFLAAWMDAVGIKRAHAIGNSAGCQVAAALAQRHPDRVYRLVLQGPSVDPTARTYLRQGARWVRFLWREPFVPWLDGLRDLRDLGPIRTARETRRMFDDRIEDRLQHVQAPTLVVRGEHDPLVPQQWAERARDLLPRGQLVVVPGVHIMNLTQPKVLVAVVAPFLRLPALPSPKRT